MEKIKIKKLSDLATVPTKGSEKAAGWDLYAALEQPVQIYPGETKKISTDIAVEPPEGYFGAIFPRSGLATKQGLRLANSTGICDEDYRGAYIIPLHNDSDYIRTINPKERIAQVVFLPYYASEIQVVAELSNTDRGANGFGSTGTR